MRRPAPPARLGAPLSSPLARIEPLSCAGLPVCIARIPGSLSDDPGLLGRPRDFELRVRGLEIAAGAGFLVVRTGDVLQMPGLPRRPRAEDIAVDGRIVGLA